MQKPTVISYIDQKIRAVDDKSANEIAHGVFETNQWSDLGLAIRQVKNRVRRAGCEVARHPDARDRGKRRKRISQRNVFAERNQMHFSIHLFFPVWRSEQLSIVGATAFFVIRAKQKVGA